MAVQLTGIFQGSNQAARLSTAAVFDGRRFTADVRFSSLRPAAADVRAGIGPEGMAVRIGAFGHNAVVFLAATVPPGGASRAATGPVSELGMRYHSTRAYGLVDAEHRTRWARLEWHPFHGNSTVRGNPNGLSARFLLCAWIPAGGVDTRDRLAVWREPAVRVGLGTMTLRDRVPAERAPELDLDPFTLPPGLRPAPWTRPRREPAAAPILLA